MHADVSQCASTPGTLLSTRESGFYTETTWGVTATLAPIAIDIVQRSFVSLATCSNCAASPTVNDAAGG